MNQPWILRVLEGEGYTAELSGLAVLGRQKGGEKEEGRRPPWHRWSEDGWRVVLAPLGDVSISREHLEVNPLREGRFHLCNRSQSLVVSFPHDRELAPGETVEVYAPVEARLGKLRIRLEMSEEAALECLPSHTIAPGSVHVASMMSVSPSVGPAMDVTQLSAWLSAFLTLLESAAGSEDFFTKAARFLVDLVQLDSGRVLLRADDKWVEKVVQRHGRTEDKPGWRASNHILSSVLRERKTFWKVPEGGSGSSIRGIEAMVAAPILNRHGDVIGALYGERRLGSDSNTYRPINRLDAMLVEVLAKGVAAGLSRSQQEQLAIKNRLQMEQFFTPSLAAKLVDHPELLEGRDTEVSVLVCDLRGFSRISEKLGSARTIGWIRDVMSELSQCVLDHEGVLVDYIGDELMAMWGAPEHQPNHATLACHAGLAMLDRLPKLSAKWFAVLQEDLEIGIGINSGPAQVGNVGSNVKFKYGPLGNTVNLASRVQGATRALKTPLLITEATQTALLADPGNHCATRRLCQVRVHNIVQPLALYELVHPSSLAWVSLKQGYESALQTFTNREFREACRILGRLVLDHRNDGPALILLSRAVQCLVADPAEFDPVMELPK